MPRAKATSFFGGGMLSNAWSGYELSGLNLFYGCYQVVMSALCAQFLFISGIVIRYCYLLFANFEKGKEIQSWYLVFLSGVSVSLGFFLYSLIDPVMIEFSEERNIILLGVSVFFFSPRPST